ncbi:hypothetical protein [Solilutibacter silvestris]|uniref:PH domain-containing protein n=1 Tax=Solilutibacter silvestris TaxID=1645665 RepID=A0A2K1Q467_9GAMM|nr:hypothetical protein [Lysobacter silvestris]PNS09747.1 hypothetical protein Lysil_1376 [Lysobacter silvestris]
MQLKPRTWTNQLRLLGLAIIVAAGLTLQKHSIAGWVCVALLAILFIAVVLNAVLPGSSYLRLEPSGMTIRSAYRDHRYSWTDISEFFVVPIGGRQMVCWHYSPSYKGQKALRALSKNVTGVDAGLPDTYGYSATDLAQLLNQWRVQYGGARPN